MAAFTSQSNPRAKPFLCDTDSKLVLVDNCASASISHDTADFISPLVPSNHKIKGFGGIVTDLLVGTIKWQIEDDEGQVHDVVLPNSYYAKNAPIRLLSPQHWSQTATDSKGTWCATHHNKLILYWKQEKYKRTLAINNDSNNVARLYTASGYKKSSAFCASCSEDDSELVYSTVGLDDESSSECEDDDGSAGSDYDQWPNATANAQEAFELNGPSGNPQTVTHDESFVPEDKSAELLMWHQRYGHVSFKRIRMMAESGIIPRRLANARVPACTACLYGKATRRAWRTRAEPNKIGHRQAVTTAGGCVSVDQMESPTPGLIAQMRGIPTKRRYRVATIFVDHHSGASFVYLQESTTSEETVQAKLAFEAWSETSGVQIKHYHADNGRFADNAFREAVAKSNQTLTFSGVNAHFQNGVAEKRIRDLLEGARTMLIHSASRWPDAINAHLWPYALRMANAVHNEVPDIRRKATPMQLYSGSKITHSSRHYHHFGCPIYVLDSALQAGHAHNKWQERARIGIYLGPSPKHARSVALVLSLTSGLTSPQFHVTFDSTFSTLKDKFSGGVQPPKSQWQYRCHFKEVPRDIKLRDDPVPKTATDEVGNERIAPAGNEGGEDPPPNDQMLVGQPEVSNDLQPATVPVTAVTRSGRQVRRPQRYIEMYSACDIPTDNVSIAMAASSDPDTMYYHQAMREPDADKFREAMQQEIDSHLEAGNLVIVNKTDVPKGASLLPAVWQMKRKRRIATQEIYKWKARLNIDGSRQIYGVNYWETYAPVARWTTIRVALAIIVANKLKVRQIDFVLAYTQAEAETELLYMQKPKGIEVEGDKVFKIVKNLYGQKQAGRVWNNHLTKHLKQIGFIQSECDECLFVRNRTIYVLYTDDSILASPTDAELDTVLADMKRAGLQITVEGTVEDFLGVKMQHNNDGSITMTQPHLIQQVLKDLNLLQDSAKSKDIPAPSSVLLTRNPESEPFDGSFEYRSVIGKLLYLEKSTRPDITFAVHQAARFSSDPQVEHGKAVRWLGRYLKGTSTKGITVKPDKTQSLKCYADADFSGAWDHVIAMDDPDTSRSRSGYVITYWDVPLIWVSRLQTLTALSTTEAEYISLSESMREVIPMMELLKELSTRHILDYKAAPIIKCTAFEDNTGAIELAKVPKMRPRTKHINLKYHHFRHHVANGEVLVEQCDTSEQVADILTKPCPRDILAKHRLKLMGW